MALNLNTLTVFKASAVDNDPVTASVSPAADRLVLAIIAKRSGTSITATSVASSFAIVGTWQRAEFAIGGNRNQAVEIWYAVTDSDPGSGTVQVTWSANVGATIAIVEVEDAGEIGLTAKNTGLGNVQPSVTFSETPGATSLVIAAATTTNESDGMTPDAAYTELVDEINTLGTNPVRLQVQYKIGGADTGIGWSDVAGESWAAVAIEIKSAGPDETAPTLQSATISADGESLSLAFDESVTIGSGGSGGFALDASGGAVTATYDSGDESSTLVYALSRAIEYDETVTLDYTQPGDGIEDLAGNDLASFSGSAAANNSVVGKPADPTEGIDSSWPLDEESGGAADTLGLNNLSEFGTVTRVAGMLGNAARFTGAGSQGLTITNANQTGLDIGAGAFSFEVWLTPTGADTGVVLLKANGFDGYALVIQNVGGSNAILGFAAPLDTPAIQLLSGVLTLNEPLHVVVTYDPEIGGVLYVDNEEVDTCNPVATNFNNNGTFGIGSTSASPTAKADVHHVRKWHRALIAQDVDYLYNEGAGRTDDELFAEGIEAPANLTVTDEAPSSISVSWDAVEGALSYRIYRDSILIGETSSTTFTARGLRWETQYAFQVSAVDAEASESDRSAAVQGETGEKPAIALVLLGDSDTDEYRADDDRGQDPYKEITLNWSEILVNERAVDLGEWDTWGGVRRSGYERNWARSGHKLENLSSQYPGAAGQIADGDANAVVIGIGINDWKLANGLPGQIYNGTLSGSTLDALLDTHFGYLATAITALVDAGAAAVAVQHIPDEMLLPISWGEYDDAEKRQLVHDAIGSLNDLIDTLSVLYPCVVTLPVNEYLEDQLALVVDGFLDVGGVPIHAFEKGYAPNYMRLGDQSGHLGTVGNCLKINFVLQNTESLWGLVSEPFSDEEILALVGLSSEPVEVGQDQTTSATSSAYAASVSHEPLTASQDATASATASAYDASAASQQSIEAAQDQTASVSTGAYAASVTTSPLEAAQGATARATTSAYSASAGTGVSVAAAQDATASATSTAYEASVTHEAKTASQDSTASALASAFAALVTTEPKAASQDGTAAATANAYNAIAGAAAKRATQGSTARATSSAYAGAVSLGPAVTATQAATASATANAYAAAVALGTPVTASQDQAARATTGAFAASVLFVDTSEILSTVEVALRDALTLNTALQDALTLTAKLGD